MVWRDWCGRLRRKPESGSSKPEAGSGNWKPAAGSRQPATGYWLLATGSRAQQETRLHAGGVEGVRVNRDPGIGAKGVIDGHYVEPARAVRDAVPGQVFHRHGGDLPLLSIGDALGREAELRRGAGPHLDEHDHAAVFADDVDFAMLRAVAAIKNCVPAGEELRNREILACFTELLAQERHGAPASQDARRRRPRSATLRTAGESRPPDPS